MNMITPIRQPRSISDLVTHHTWARIPSCFTAIVACLLLATGCHPASQKACDIAAANSYLDCAARDLLGSDIPIMPMAEPGGCPGHFDLTARQAYALQHCRLLIRFDFQKGLDEKLAGNTNLHIASIMVSGGMCQARVYYSVCEQIGKALTETGLAHKDRIDRRLEEIQARTSSTYRHARAQFEQAGATNLVVLASPRQKDFCEDMGWKVPATFLSADLVRPEDMDHAIQTALAQGARMVVANAPEGRRAADALGERLHLPVVMIENFPNPKLGQDAYDQMILSNVRRLTSH